MLVLVHVPVHVHEHALLVLVHVLIHMHVSVSARARCSGSIIVYLCVFVCERACVLISVLMTSHTLLGPMQRPLTGHHI